jgi:hypothetical protein
MRPLWLPFGFALRPREIDASPLASPREIDASPLASPVLRGHHGPRVQRVTFSGGLGFDKQGRRSLVHGKDADLVLRGADLS